jgi:hypothetical protein
MVTLRTSQYAATIINDHTQQLAARLNATKAALVITAALAALERSHLPKLVQVTNGTTLLTESGTPHPVSGVGLTSRPRSDSAVITSVEIDPRYRGRIARSTFSGTSVELDVCDAPQIPTKDQFRSYLAIGLQGLCQFTGTLATTGNNCLSFSGSPTAGMFAGGPCPAASLLEFAPISREFSLFVDRTGELRLVSHVGMRILENQPIARGFRSLEVNEIADSSGTLLYRLTVTPSISRALSFNLPAPLARTSLWNEILL